ncbi:hypothetical protein NP493_1560g00019 [Ridgeia piscesae]|uniref:Uncharacterized protein n=1 Tax=Ridgeia piscesae TaxID=27915 RepID=A0AAD9NB77_RIDPI|nr:hypothetical protein NP493_1560g00019 [Ridgeia piscesae]
MATFKTKINLWVRSEIFAYGALPVPPHPRLSVHNIKKIIPYAKSKGKSGFPRLGYSVWKNIACNKLQLPMDLAWMYFVTFDMLVVTMPEERLERDEMFAKCTSQQELELCKSKMSVPLLRFVLFLYLQHFHKISLRSSLASGNVEWPVTSQPPELDTRSSSARGKSLDEHSHMTFVLNNLKEILDLLAQPDVSSDTKETCLSVDAVEALGFIIAGSVDSNRTEKTLHEIAMMQQVYQKSGYSKVNVATSRSPRGWKLVVRLQALHPPHAAS